MPELGTIVDKSLIKSELGKQDYWKNQYQYLDGVVSDFESRRAVAQSDFNKYFTKNLNQLEDLGKEVTRTSLEGSLAEDSIFRDYGANIAEAFKSARQNEVALLGSNLGQGFKSESQNELENVLNQAYNSYFSTMQSNKNTLRNSVQNTISNLVNNITKSKSSLLDERSTFEADWSKAYEDLIFQTGKTREEIDKALSTEAQNYTDFLESPFVYLASKQFNELVNQNPEILSSPDFADLVNKEVVGGQIQYTLKPINGIRNRIINNPYRANAFYSLLNMNDELGYGDWLYENNKKLYDWAIENQNNVYDLAGLNAFEWKEKDWSVPASKLSSTSTDVTGRVSKYAGGVDVYDDLVLGNNSAVRDKDNDNFTVTYNGNAYSLEIEEGDVSEDIVSKIYNATGDIQNNKLYRYNDELYIGIVETDSSGNTNYKLRKVKGQGSGGDYDKLLKNAPSPSVATTVERTMGSNFTDIFRSDAEVTGVGTWLDRYIAEPGRDTVNWLAEILR